MSRLSYVPLAVLFLAILAVVAALSLFTVDQRSQALVLQFGEPVRVIQQPGLYAKLPLIQEVVTIDKRVLDFEPAAEEVIAADQKRLLVDSFARYRISDPLQYYRSVHDERGMTERLGALLSGSLRRVIGGVVLGRLLSPERTQIMGAIRDEMKNEASGLGIDIIDVRIRRADLPIANSQAIFQRMQSEREREAKEFRAQGAEQAQGIRARAEKDRTVILAEAQRQAQVTRGQGDADSIRIYADAFGQDPGFFAFYRSLQAYGTALDNNTTMVLSAEDPFLQYLEHGGHTP